MKLLLGIDLGTRGTKAVLYAESGECRAEAFEASRPRCPAPGVVEEDPELQLASVQHTIAACLRQAAADPADVAALGMVGQMAGVIGVDAAGRAVTPYDSWLDTRCSAYIAQMQQLAGDEVLLKTGHAPSFNHGPKKLWWKNERPSDYARIRTFVQPAAYVAMRLCALDASRAFIDPTYLHFSGFADNRAGVWDDDLCRRFAFEREKLPAIVNSAAIVGGIAPAMASACGLRADTPVVAGCGDTAASFLACGATSPGLCVDVAGTASVFAATTGEFVPDSANRTLGCGRSVLPGLWHPYAYINGGGQTLEWFRANFAGGSRSFEDLTIEAADATRDQSLPFFVPHLGGRVSPADPSLRGSWAGLDWSVTLGMMFRSVLESVALEYALYQRALRNLLPSSRVQEIRVTGGGEKNPVWNQLKADRLRTRVVSLARSGGAPMGAALLAGHGAGVLPDLAASANRWISFGRHFEPDPATEELSARRVERYAALLRTLGDWHGAP